MADGTIKILTDLSTEGFKKGLSSLGSLAKTGLSVVSSAMTATGTAIAALGGAAAKVGSDFETSIAKASTLFGGIEVDTKKLNGSVLQLSSSTGIAANTIGESLYNALSSGIPVTEDMGEAMDYMKKSADLARAGFTDIDTAATSTAKVLNAYKMDVSETDRVHKILMATQNKGITTVNELGAVLAQVTPTAAAMNVSFEQVGAALATMTAQGTPTAQATTQLNSLFAELGKKGTVASKALEKATEGTKYAGKGFSDLMAEGVPLNEVLDLMGVHADMSDQSLIDMFGSIEAGKAALSMAGQNSEQFSSNLSAMSTSADLVGEAVAKMDDTLQARSAKMMESVKNLGITIYDSLQAPLKDAVDLGIGYISKLNDAFANGFDSGIEAAGKVIADIAVKAAEMTPKMLDAGKKAILAFCNGLEKNSQPISKAAVKIGKTLVSGFTKIVPQVAKVGLKIVTEFSKELFGSKIGSQVEKLGKAIQDGFSKIGAAVVKAMDKIGPAVEKVGTVFISLATGAITVLADGISFLAENCGILIPALAAVAAGMVAWSIFNTISSGIGAASTAITVFTTAVAAEGVAHAASTVAITAKQVAMGVLSGQISIVTAAQWLWNAAMTANPIGLVIAGVAALGVGIAALCLIQKEQLTSEEKLAEANANLGETYTEMLGKFGEYQKGVDAAKSKLDTLNSATGLTAEKQQELAGQMEDCQRQINAVCETATSERRQLTEDEITTLESLMQKQREIAAQEQALYQGRAQSAQTYAEQIASSSRFTAEEFMQEAQNVSKTAQDAYDQRVSAANEYMLQQLAQLEQEAAVNEEVKANYESRKDTIISAYQSEKDAAQQQMDATNALLADGYAARATTAQEWVQTSQAFNASEILAKQARDDAILAAEYEYNQISNKNSTQAINALEKAENEKARIEKKYASDIAEIRGRKNDNLKNISSDEIATLMDMVDRAGGCYQNLNSETQQMVGQFLKDIGSLDEPTRASMNKTLNGMGLEINKGGDLMKVNADGSMTKFITGFSARERDAVAAMERSLAAMNNKSKNKTYDAGKMGAIKGGTASASTVVSAIQSYYNSHPTYVTTYARTVKISGNRDTSTWAKGGVTRYAKGGVSPKIHKHAAGVFTKRTRLWDPATGINEYGEAGHEALLPLKSSVYNEIAKGIIRQLSPAKLASMMSMIQSTVRNSMSDLSLQITAKADYSATRRESGVQDDSMLDRILEKMDAMTERLERLAGLTVALDGQKVGTLIAPTVNQGLGEIYSLEERGKF